MEPSQQIHDEGTRTSLKHSGNADRAKSDNEDTLALPVRLHTKSVEAFQHGECKVSINSASYENPTIT